MSTQVMESQQSRFSAVFLAFSQFQNCRTHTRYCFSQWKIFSRLLVVLWQGDKLETAMRKWIFNAACSRPSDKYVYYYIMQRQTFKYTYPYILLVLPILPVCLRFRMTKQTSKQINQTKPANNKHRERSRWFCFATPTSARSNHVLWAANLLNTSTTTMASTSEEQTVVAPQLNTKDVTLFTFHMAPSLCFPCY